METDTFEDRRQAIVAQHAALLRRPNLPVRPGNGIFLRYQHPVLTAEHTPLEWRFDFSQQDNPFFQERLGVNSVFNAGAILDQGRYLVLARVEGYDRKSFFAVAESRTGVDGFEFWPEPVVLGEHGDTTTNVYDARLTRHDDGFVYALFCAERKHPDSPAWDTQSALASAGIARTRDFRHWERLPDLITPSPQQRNVVLHPTFVRGKYMLYTRPQDGFLETGTGGGIAWGLTDTMEGARVDQETILDARIYHTVKEAKNGAGPPPILTSEGWLHIAHAVRNTAAGYRYTLYAFLCAKDEPWLVTAAPGGHLMAPQDDERVGDVSNVLFANGAIVEPDGRVLLYYASSDTRLHVAESSVDRLLDYVLNTPPDPLTSGGAVQQRLALLTKNRPQG